MCYYANLQNIDNYQGRLRCARGELAGKHGGVHQVYMLTTSGTLNTSTLQADKRFTNFYNLKVKLSFTALKRLIRPVYRVTTN